MFHWGSQQRLQARLLEYMFTFNVTIEVLRVGAELSIVSDSAIQACPPENTARKRDFPKGTR